MGSVAQAVVEFDEAVRSPWRPPLAGAAGRRAQLRVVPEVVAHADASRSGGGRVPVRPSAPGPRRPPAPTRRPTADRTAAAEAAPGLRLTRRARRLGVVLGLAVGVVVGSWVGSAVTGGEDGLRLAGESSVVVQQGDTLWTIAAAVAGDGDVRAVIAEIRQLNGLADASLVPGQLLVLP